MCCLAFRHAGDLFPKLWNTPPSPWRCTALLCATVSSTLCQTAWFRPKLCVVFFIRKQYPGLPEAICASSWHAFSGLKGSTCVLFTVFKSISCSSPDGDLRYFLRVWVLPPGQLRDFHWSPSTIFPPPQQQKKSMKN